MLGNGAGTMARAYAHYFPDTAIDAVEIDGELLDIGRALVRPARRGRGCACTPRTRGRSCGGTERALRRDLRRHLPPALHPVLPDDAGVLPARARPAAARAASVLINVGHPEDSDQLEKVLTRHDGQRRSRTSCATRSRATNTVLIASDTAPSRGTLLTARRVRARRPAAARRSTRPARLAPALTGGDVYTDDRAPVEWLVDASIVHEAAEEAPAAAYYCLNGSWSSHSALISTHQSTASRRARSRTAGSRSRGRPSRCPTSCG